MLDPAAVRAHFPALDPHNHGGTAPIYFDNPPGTQIAGEAMSRMQDYLVHRNANHGGASRASRESDAMVHDTRAALADFLGAARAGGDFLRPEHDFTHPACFPLSCRGALPGGRDRSDPAGP